MSKRTYIVESYDPATRKIERVTVTHEVYNAYRRSGWNIADNNPVSYTHLDVYKRQDITLKKVINNPGTLETTRSIANQMQMKQIQDTLKGIQEMQSYQSVSYTHLDVYKRQIRTLSISTVLTVIRRPGCFGSKPGALLTLQWIWSRSI